MDDYSNRSLHGLVLSDLYYDQVHHRLEDPNVKNTEGYTLLHSAAYSKRDNHKIMKLLLDRGGDFESRTPSGHTPLHLAVSRRKRGAITAIIEAGASINSKDFSGKTILHFAIGAKWSQPSEHLLSLACDMWILERLLREPDIIVNPIDDNGETPLIWAVKERNYKVVSTLLKMGGNPCIPDRENRTPLHLVLSARQPRYDIVYTLLLNRAGIYCEDNSGQTPVDVLLRHVRDDDDRIAKECMRMIAFRYKIRESLKKKLEKIPQLLEHLNECYKEVKLMNEMIIFDKFTLHDFGVGCLQEPVRDPMQIYIPIVEILLSGLFNIYYKIFYERVSRPDLQTVLARTVEGKFSPELVISHRMKLTTYEKIKRLYEEDDELKRRLRKYKNLI